MRAGRLAAALVLTAVALAACGSSSPRPAATTAVADARPPAHWTQVTIPDGATLAYPARWKRIKADPGTASAALIDRAGIFVGYLNITPRQGTETLADWPRFRLDHNADEGEHQVSSLSVRRNVIFHDARGTCLTDSYTTSTHVRYEEMACLVVGGRHGAVVVGATPAAQWRQTAPVLERGIHSLNL